MEPTKVCTKCAERKPFSDYQIRRIAKAGHPTYNGACKKCEQIQRGKWAKRHRRKRNAQARKRRRKLRATNPEWYGAVLAQNREWAERKRRERGAPIRARASAPPDRTTVDAAPFRAWLQKVHAENDWTISELEIRLGFSETAMRPIWDGRRKFVELTTVERALIEEGSTVIDDLYPLQVAA